MFNNLFSHTGIKVISKYEDGPVTICLSNMGKQTVNLTANHANIVLDLNHEQSNAEHRNAQYKVIP